LAAADAGSEPDTQRYSSAQRTVEPAAEQCKTVTNWQPIVVTGRRRDDFSGGLADIAHDAAFDPAM
jgi:hypothetical protein